MFDKILKLTQDHNLMMKINFFGFILNCLIAFMLWLTMGFQMALVVMLLSLGYVIAFFANLAMKRIKMKKAKHDDI